MSQILKFVENFSSVSEKNTTNELLFPSNKSHPMNISCFSPSKQYNFFSTSSRTGQIMENQTQPEKPNIVSFYYFPINNLKETRIDSLYNLYGNEKFEDFGKKVVNLDEKKVTQVSLCFEKTENSENKKMLEIDDKETRSFSSEDKNNKFHSFKSDIIKTNDLLNSNFCPKNNLNLSIQEIKNNFKELEDISKKIKDNLELLYINNPYLINQTTKSNDSKSTKNLEDTQKNSNLTNENGKIKLKLSKLNSCFIKNKKNNILSLGKIHIRKIKLKNRGFKYHILTEEMKEKLLIDAKNMRTVEVAKKYGISTRNVNRWKKKGIYRKIGSGRKFKDPRLEKKILEWYRVQDKDTLTSKEFKEKAIELSDNKTFRASSGWLTNIKRKYNIKFKK